ncbi:F-box/kelch-repeat protein At3g23880-like [Alnus glutinosa]|uniref:F-box/kelch-repeat protein At3g23880-like n=1 Tax=Alnus glutinosa TaxID=3517 RepID=UPI002D77DBC9|nr:F-box/kelch-repeat protein At3g23880-like [Alnus glutinosa]
MVVFRYVNGLNNTVLELYSSISFLSFLDFIFFIESVTRLNNPKVFNTAAITPFMAILLKELIPEILARLPVKSLVQFQLVSKQWKALINESGFINTHFQLSIAANRDRTLILHESGIALPMNFFCLHFNDDDGFDGALANIRQPLHDGEEYSQILDSCNGLVCLHNHGRRIVIWNPLIRRCKKLPSEPKEDAQLLVLALAFGHDPEERRSWRVQFHDMPDSIETAICVGSLVLLDGDSVNDNTVEQEGLNRLVEEMEKAAI